MKRTAVGIVLFFVALQSIAQTPSIATSTQEGWQKIGEATASFTKQRMSIQVIGGDKFNALRLKVTDAPIKIEQVQVFFKSGEIQEVDINSELLPGAVTEEFPIVHKDRAIQKIAFTYRTIANANVNKAHVELYGIKTDIEEPSNAYQKSNSIDPHSESDSTEGNDPEQGMRDGLTASDSVINQAGQELNDAAENIEDDVENGAERISNDTLNNPENNAQAVTKSAANAASGIADKKIENKSGPQNQSIYREGKSKYYYINNEGKKVTIDKRQLKDKQRD